MRILRAPLTPGLRERGRAPAEMTGARQDRADTATGPQRGLARLLRAMHGPGSRTEPLA